MNRSARLPDHVFEPTPIRSAVTALMPALAGRDGPRILHVSGPPASGLETFASAVARELAALSSGIIRALPGPPAQPDRPQILVGAALGAGWSEVLPAITPNHSVPSVAIIWSSPEWLPLPVRAALDAAMDNEQAIERAITRLTTPKQLRHAVSEALGHPALPDGFGGLLFRRTAGLQPLIIAQLQHLQARDVLAHTQAGWHINARRLQAEEPFDATTVNPKRDLADPVRLWRVLELLRTQDGPADVVVERRAFWELLRIGAQCGESFPLRATWTVAGLPADGDTFDRLVDAFDTLVVDHLGLVTDVAMPDTYPGQVAYAFADIHIYRFFFAQVGSILRQSYARDLALASNALAQGAAPPAHARLMARLLTVAGESEAASTYALIAEGRLPPEP